MSFFVLIFSLLLSYSHATPSCGPEIKKMQETFESKRSYTADVMRDLLPKITEIHHSFIEKMCVDEIHDTTVRALGDIPHPPFEAESIWKKGQEFLSRQFAKDLGKGIKDERVEKVSGDVEFIRPDGKLTKTVKLCSKVLAREGNVFVNCTELDENIVRELKFKECEFEKIKTKSSSPSISISLTETAREKLSPQCFAEFSKQNTKVNPGPAPRAKARKAVSTH